MNKLVKEQLKEMLDVFESLPACKVEKGEGDKLLIVSHKPVPWSGADGESPFKIGTIIPHKAALGLYIDFPHGLFELEKLEEIINPEATLYYYPPGEKASNVKSWWRFRSDEKFDSVHMVLRKVELEHYDFKREDWIGLMQQITEIHE